MINYINVIVQRNIKYKIFLQALLPGRNILFFKEIFNIQCSVRHCYQAVYHNYDVLAIKLSFFE